MKGKKHENDISPQQISAAQYKILQPALIISNSKRRMGTYGTTVLAGKELLKYAVPFQR